jgi:hypothetical protein
VRRAGVVLAAGAAYLAVASVVWWHLWPLGLAHGISRTQVGDADQDVWFLAWVPHALGSGLNPFVSRAMFAPKGINLLLNTSILFPSLLLSPITELFGPLVSFNLAVLLAPVANALSAFVVFRRWAAFAPGRWLAGLFYGFSPFVLNDLIFGHLHVTILVFPPIALALLDDLLVSQRGSPVVKGALLGLVFTAQFLTGEEVGLMMAILALLGITILAVRHPRDLRLRWRRAAVGLVSSGLVAGVLLAFPLYELFAGPRRFQGTVFPDPYSYVVWLQAALWPRRLWPQTSWPMYAGVPLLAVVTVGCVRIRSGALRFAATMSGVALVFACGVSLSWSPSWSTHIPLPDAIFRHWPLVRNLLPIRFDLMVDMFLALALAVVLDRVHQALVVRWAGAAARDGEVAGRHDVAGAQSAATVPAGGELAGWRSEGAAEVSPSDSTAATVSDGAESPAVAGSGDRTRRGGRPRPAVSWLGGLAAVGLGTAALVSPALGAPIPFATRRLSIPAVFESPVVTDLPRGTILLGYPIPNGYEADPLVWQAEEYMPYDLVAGYGFVPGSGIEPIGSLPASPAVTIYGDAELGLLPPTPAREVVMGVRRNLESWHVSVIVEVAGGGQMKQPGRLAAVIDAATGVKAEIVDGADVWRLSR